MIKAVSMAISIQQAFETLKRNLEITDLQSETVSTRQQNVRKVVGSGLSVTDDFLTGSYKRNTMIAPLSEADIDAFMVLDNQYFYHYDGGKNMGQAGLLDLVKRTLRQTYTKTPDISRNGQAVTIHFNDFMVDVVPGFTRKGGGYLIPNSVSQSWISTDPKKHVEIFSAANAGHNGDFIPLVKMIKAWNKTIGQHFRSFHLEVLALQILTNVQISDFPSGARYFFDKGREKIKFQTADPAGYSGDVGSYISSSAQIQEAVGKFQIAFDRAIKAEDYATRGHTADAVGLWQKIFGDYFPNYY
jgi:hypothetical protein